MIRWLAIDAYALKNKAGLGTYTERIIAEWLDAGCGKEMAVFTAPGAVSDRFRSLPRSREALEVMAPRWAGNRFLFEEGWLAGAAKRSGSEVFYNPDFTLPFTLGQAGVVTIHDLSFWEFPGSSSLQAGILYGLKVPFSVRRAKRVVVISRSTGQAVKRRFPETEEKQVHVPNGVESDFKPLTREASGRKVRNQFGISAPFILGVGTLEPRKNWTLVGEALAASSDPALQGLHFVLCGGKGRGAGKIQERLGKMLPGRVHFLNPLNRSDLKALYSSCEMLAYPSRYEGFGLPVLEALACGRPVVTSKVSSLPEAAGGAALLVDPDDSAALGKAMSRLLADSALRSRLKRLGLAQARRFSWSRTAKKIWEVLSLVRKER